MPFVSSVRGSYGAQGKRKVQTGRIGAGATGGTITTAGGYRIHTFTAVGTSTFIADGSGDVEVLMVGGGGGAGSYSGGGGGGEVLFISRNISSSSYSLTVGAGGIGETSQEWHDTRNGNSTTAFGETAKPGGGARSSDDRTVPINGTGVYATVANGGGGSSRSGGYFGSVGTSVGAGVTRYGGNRGGQDTNDSGSINQSPNYPGGGGGGAGASVTGNTGGGNNASAGGIGVVSSITGTAYYYGGGGGGGTYYGGSGGNGGNGGGGAGSGGGGGGTGGAGINAGGNGGTGAGGYGGTGTGGGGGGGRGETNARGGDGGSGIVVIRYLF